MNARRPVWPIALRILAAALLCAAAGVPAQTIYKQVDAAGHTTYTDRPDTTLPPQTAAVPALDVTAALASNAPMSSRGAALIDANEAARRLRQAQLERELGAERLPGEQARSADASVANQRYRQRQDELRRGVELAQRRSSDAVRLLAAYR